MPQRPPQSSRAITTGIRPNSNRQRSWKNLVAIPFAEADMLDIHLQIGAPPTCERRMRGNPRPSGSIPIGMAALDGVLRGAGRR